jgi:hypothetical protein
MGLLGKNKKIMSKNTFIQIAAILFTLFLVFIIYCANIKADLIFFRLLKYIPFGDKVGHTVLLGTLTFLVNWAMQARTFIFRKFQILTGSCIVFILITLEEISQNWLDNRTFDLFDLGGNYLGISLGSYAIYRLFKKPFQTK